MVLFELPLLQMVCQVDLADFLQMTKMFLVSSLEHDLFPAIKVTSYVIDNINIV